MLQRMLSTAVVLSLIGVGAMRPQIVAEEKPPQSPPAARATRGSETSGQAVLSNASFEELEGRDPAGWFATRLRETSPHFELRHDPQVAHEGTGSVFLAVKRSHPDWPISYNWTRLIENWMPGSRYEVTGWIKTSNVANPAAIAVECMNADRKRVAFASTQPSHPVTGTTDWTEVKTTIIVPPGTTEVRVRAGFSSAKNHGAQAWFDDLHVVERSAMP